jgi:hypothetical protein
MSTRTVYYFCQRHLRGSATARYNELVCVRVVAPDARIAGLEKEYYTKGHIHQVVYSSSTTPIDMTWEKKCVAAQDWGFNCGKDILTVLNSEPKMQ